MQPEEDAVPNAIAMALMARREAIAGGAWGCLLHSKAFDWHVAVEFSCAGILLFDLISVDADEDDDW